MDEKKRPPNIPSNYVTLVQLQDRWMKEQQRKQKEKEDGEQRQQQQQQQLKLKAQKHQEAEAVGKDHNNRLRKSRNVTESSCRPEICAAAVAVEGNAPESERSETKKKSRRKKKAARKDEVTSEAHAPPVGRASENIQANRDGKKKEMLIKYKQKTAQIEEKMENLSIERENDGDNNNNNNNNNHNRVVNRGDGKYRDYYNGGGNRGNGVYGGYNGGFNRGYGVYRGGYNDGAYRGGYNDGGYRGGYNDGGFNRSNGMYRGGYNGGFNHGNGQYGGYVRGFNRCDQQYGRGGYGLSNRNGGKKGSLDEMVWVKKERDADGGDVDAKESLSGSLKDLE